MSSHPRRADVEGRTCCRLCRQMKRSAEGVRAHWRDKHARAWREMMAPRATRRPPFIGHDGWPRCDMRRGAKRCYASIDHAWIAAMQVFLRCGEIVTPYRCSDYWVKTRKRDAGSRVLGCGYWHVSHKISALPAAIGAAA